MAARHLFEASLTWSGAAQGPARVYDQYSREFSVEIAGKPALTGSAAPPYLGDASLHNPEDLLLIAVSSCHLLSYLALCVRAGVSVVSYRDRCTATMTVQDGRMRIVEATLRPEVVVAAGSDEAKAQALHEQANRLCFIANSVNFPIVHQPTVRSE